MNNTSSVSRIISFINNLYFQRNNTNQQQTTQGQNSSNSNTTSDSLNRSSLQTIWERLQSLSNRERVQIMSAISGSSVENPNIQIIRRTNRRNSVSEVEVSSEITIKEDIEIEYLDHTNYPLKIDWKLMSNKGPACQIHKSFGLFGVSIYCSLSQTTKMDEKNVYKVLIHNVWNLFTENKQDELNQFIGSLPSIELVRSIIKRRIYEEKEVLIIKVVLDLLEFYYRLNDQPLYIYYKQCLELIIEFLSQLDDEQVNQVYDTIFSCAETFDLLKNKMGSTLSKTKSRCMRRVKKMKMDLIKLSEGNRMSLFSN